MKSDEEAYREISENITQLLSPENSILEIATGTGIIALRLADYFNHIDAIDFSPKMINLAKIKAAKQHISNVNFCLMFIYIT